jgi:tetratricopeptide (TPR) repeat protein
MKYLPVIFIFLFHTVYSQPVDSLLAELDQQIALRPRYTEDKMQRILAYRSSTARTPKEKYWNTLRIYNEYAPFLYDSAFSYARRLQQIAYGLKDPFFVAHAKVKTGFVLVSSGMFNEALDTLRSVKARALPDSSRAEYYYVMARTCLDLADFNRDAYYGEIYGPRARAFLDSGIAIVPPSSADHLLMLGLRELHLRNMATSKEAYEKLIHEHGLNDQKFAVAASTLSFIYFYSNNQDKATEMLIKAAIADIRSCTKETLAMLNLADLLYKKGEVERAYNYIQIAMEDANFYGARHRKTQVSPVYVMIEGRQLSEIEAKRKQWLIYSIVITFCTLVVVGFSVIIYKQNKKLEKARRLIATANKSLTNTNHQLQDANKIKEEYIWYYFNTTAEYITKLDALKKTLDLKLMTKKLEDLRFTIDSINIKKEREELYHNFDKVFLKLFPDFVDVFNSMFKEEDRMVLKEGQLLNTELRIFALIRMGIHDHERIAKILDYSVTTIYTYKTRLRNKSMLANDEFDRRIMSIRAI